MKMTNLFYPLVKFIQNRSLEEAREIYEQRITDAIDVYNKHHENFILRDCPFCGASEYEQCEDFHNCYKVVKCKLCGSQYVNPAPNIEALQDYYNNSECNKMLDKIVKNRQKHTSSSFILDDRINAVIDCLTQNSKQDNINILEVGCASGAFLAKLKNVLMEKFPSKEISYSGIDIDGNAINTKVDDSLNLIWSSVEDFVKTNKHSYDIILHFELIEHLVEPFVFSRYVHDMLKQGGFMIFTTQNANGLEMKLSNYNDFRLIAHSIFPPMHLNAFSTTNVLHFAIRSGFKVVKIETPGKLDVDMVTITKEQAFDDGLKMIANLDDATKGLLQYLVSMLGCSSHMQCVLKK
ncbi:Methyltransferase type 12 [Chloroherpeton thalassium ATCC 35110]|uniref:Methyltransferase type 12 n=1 Tax=Chloroherpeton thalassium (strain ATCC 35110 / GB-78) TaxID=517418 RepID=B3QVI7_CHLT3|nr:methyltransferase domain-containing protein [Chloroherpeton thalassium]ACF14587.1 Methyltransferase type 12 [Chloroherpeton thalassium ATCC 35110]